jgi:predicted RNase H-like HicB family nuclease
VSDEFTAVFIEEADGGILGYVEELPGVRAKGTTLEQTRARLKEAIEDTVERIVEENTKQFEDSRVLKRERVATRSERRARRSGPWSHHDRPLNFEPFRLRLREAIERSGEKHSVIARHAAIAPETLSRLLGVSNQRPSFDTVVRITHAAGETVGWLLGEPAYSLSVTERIRIREAAETILARVP